MLSKPGLRITKRPLIDRSIPVSVVSSLLSSTKLFKRENTSKVFPPSFLINKPDFSINCFHFISQYDEVSVISLHTCVKCIELLKNITYLR